MQQGTKCDCGCGRLATFGYNHHFFHELSCTQGYEHHAEPKEVRLESEITCPFAIRCSRGVPRL